MQSQLFLSVAAASVKKCRILKTGRELGKTGLAEELGCIIETRASISCNRVSH